ncbi:MAG: hypothetical protein IPL25_12435 [Saprospiraceae bacterium]|nr:hypothetical protein [Candidatus Vicinibacter affinis]
MRTPSANPGFKLYYFADKWEKTKIKKAITIGYYHLSNGQDAHPLADSVKLDPKFAYINQGKHFNRYNGNFSTNYLTFGFNLFWDKEYDTPKSTKINVVSSRLLRNLNYPELPLSSTVSSFSINTELHTKNFGNSNIAILAYEPELIGYYSFLRAGLTYKLIRTYNSEIINGLAKTINQREYDRFKIYVNVALDKINKLPNYDFFSRINAEISYHMRLPYSDFVSWYAKMGFYGSDPYNIYLEDRIFYAQLGLAIGSFIF